jgi:hypothetical protein
MLAMERMGQVFLGLFAELRKATIRSFMSVCMSVRPNVTTLFPLEDFHEMWYLNNFLENMSRKLKFL